MRFFRLRITVAASLLVFALIVGNILVFGTLVNWADTSPSLVPQSNIIAITNKSDNSLSQGVNNISNTQATAAIAPPDNPISKIATDTAKAAPNPNPAANPISQPVADIPVRQPIIQRRIRTRAS